MPREAQTTPDDAGHGVSGAWASIQFNGLDETARYATLFAQTVWVCLLKTPSAAETVAFRTGTGTRTDLQNQAIGWLRKRYRSLGGGTVVPFPRIWMSSGECRIKGLEKEIREFQKQIDNILGGGGN